MSVYRAVRMGLSCAASDNSYVGVWYGRNPSEETPEWKTVIDVLINRLLSSFFVISSVACFASRATVVQSYSTFYVGISSSQVSRRNWNQRQASNWTTGHYRDIIILTRGGNGSRVKGSVGHSEWPVAISATDNKKADNNYSIGKLFCSTVEWQSIQRVQRVGLKVQTGAPWKFPRSTGFAK